VLPAQLRQLMLVPQRGGIGEQPFDFFGSRERGVQPVAETQGTLSRPASW
jgi:hypothetical protein